jgi:hypothetical protein
MKILQEELQHLISESLHYDLEDINENFEMIVENVLLEGFSDKTNKALAAKAKKYKVSLGVVKSVYRRGLSAWATGHRQGTPQHAWAMGRVNSFLSGKGGARKADDDLWKKAKKKKG